LQLLKIENLTDLHSFRDTCVSLEMLFDSNRLTLWIQDMNGDVCIDLVECSQKRSLCFTYGTALKLKGEVMVVHGKGNRAQGKACCREQAYESLTTRTATIVGLLGYVHNHLISYVINTIKSSINKGTTVTWQGKRIRDEITSTYSASDCSAENQ
jgi:hypothetical protein